MSTHTHDHHDHHHEHGQHEPRAFTPDSVPAPRTGVAWVEVDGELVVMDEWDGSLHLLNPSAGLVFQCLDGSSTIREIATDFAEELGLPLEQMLADIANLASELDARRLLHDDALVASHEAAADEHGAAPTEGADAPCDG